MGSEGEVSHDISSIEKMKKFQSKGALKLLRDIEKVEIIKAICLNGQGFNESRLYLYSDYFENLPTDRLLGEGILPKHINDDVLGRTLD